MAIFESGVAGSGNVIVDSIAGSVRYVPGQTLDYYFANATDDFYGFDPLADGFGVTGDRVSFSFQSEMLAAFASVSAVVNIDFAQVFTQTSSDFSYYGADNLSAPGLPPGLEILAAHQFPGIFTAGNQSVAPSVFNESSVAMNTAAELGGGNIAISTAIHELGHGMGLGHPSDNGNGSLSAISGTVLDDARYTLMTAQASGANAFGQAVSFMALDIAALQHLYGADMTTHLGATTYSLTDAQTTALDIDGSDGDISIGRAYYSIWDAGGADDEINYSGSDRVLINLNDATLKQTLDAVTDADLIALLNEVENSDAFDTLSNTVQTEMMDANRTAGGYFSQVLDANGNAIDGGFTIANGAVIENASGSGGNDILIGNEVANQLIGNGGDDALFGGAGSDMLIGGAGEDALFGGSGADALFGGSGIDTADYSGSASGVTVFTSGRGGRGGDAQGDKLDSIENIIGSEQQDQIVLNAATAVDNTVNAGAGDDRIRDRDGGTNVLNGEDGDDNIFGGIENDTLNGGNDEDKLFGGQGNDTINGGDDDARDALFGSSGDDILNGGGGNDALRGNTGMDTLNGGDGADNLQGGNQNDILNGDAGVGTLDGGSGEDTLNGGTGNDRLTGGASNDLFVFENGSGVDRITDFNFGSGDQIDLSDFNLADFDAVMALAFELNGDVRIQLDGDDRLILENITLAELDANDFVL